MVDKGRLRCLACAPEPWVLSALRVKGIDHTLADISLLASNHLGTYRTIAGSLETSAQWLRHQCTSESSGTGHRGATDFFEQYYRGGLWINGQTMFTMSRNPLANFLHFFYLSAIGRQISTPRLAGSGLHASKFPWVAPVPTYHDESSASKTPFLVSLFASSWRSY